MCSVVKVILESLLIADSIFIRKNLIIILKRNTLFTKVPCEIKLFGFNFFVGENNIISI